jgi:hypothetical protein
MSGPLQLPQPDMRPGGYIPPGPMTPNPLESFLSMFMQVQQQARQNKNSDAAIAEHQANTAVATGTLKLEQEKQKTEQARIDQLATETDNRGKAVQAFMKAAQPAIEQHLQSHPEVVSGLMGGQQGGGSPLAMGGQAPGPQMPGAGSPLAMPVQQPIAPPQAPSDGTGPIPTWGQMVQTMSPAAAAAFVQEDLPKLLAAQKGMQDVNGPQYEQSNTGGFNTVMNKKTGLTFDPSKGLPMTDSGAWVPAIARTQTEDQKAESAAHIVQAQANAASQRAYQSRMENVNYARQFDSRLKTLRDRAPILQQAAMSLYSAAHDPNINNRQVLGTTATIQFLQAADQKGQLRSTLVQMAQAGLDPSMIGTLEKFVSGKTQGVMPPRILDAMAKHVNNLLVLTKKEYDAQYAGEMKRHPNALLTPSEDIFSQVPNTPAPPEELPPPP